jgi:UDP-N-acetylmuramate--alanine ligase
MTPAHLDLSTPRRVHIVGVGGAGMGAIATVLAEMGHRVTGSDLKGGPALDRLARLGIGTFVGHAAEHVGAVDVVAVSSAVPAANPEVRTAVERGIPVLRRAELLAAVCSTKPTMAVSGTHGKTTTSSMLASVLLDGGLHPSFIVGGDLNELGTGARWDRTGRWLVVEADESDGTFVEIGATAVVVTNVEPDHLDHWGSTDALAAAFDGFMASATGPVVACADDPVAARLGAAHGAVTYGTAPGANYRMVDVRTSRDAVVCRVEHEGDVTATIDLPVPGVHNATNACGALVAGVLLGADPRAAEKALARFGGVARRFETRGERDGVVFVDDYAHNPGKVRAVLAAARGGDWGRVVCVFQPHRYSRTRDLAHLWGEAFVDADVLVVTEVYAAGEEPLPGVTGEMVADAVRRAHPRAAVVYDAEREGLAGRVRALLRPGDLCLTLGAGDLTLLPDEVLAQW